MMATSSDLFDRLLFRRDHIETREDTVIPATIDEVASILRNARRRWIIVDLDENGASRLADIADRRSHFVYGPKFSTTERKREYVTMYQTHLPTLAEAGVVEFRQRDPGNAVRPGEHFEGYVEALDALSGICLDPEPFVDEDEEVDE